MKHTLPALSALAAILLPCHAMAQACYDGEHACFTFAPERQEAGKIETGLIGLESKKLTFSGDIRLRLRDATSPGGVPYADGDQQATRGRARLIYDATENARVFLEFNFSETWAGSDSYSDALAGEDFNGISQLYMNVSDMFGGGFTWRVGRSEYILANGLILGSCDYLQRPSTFTGAWVSRSFEGHAIELFMLDDYGPGQFQAANPGAGGVRYFGGTAKVDIKGLAQVDEDKRFVFEALRPYYMAGSGEGDRPSNDDWFGIDASGQLPWEIDWDGGWARRFVDVGDDNDAMRLHLEKHLGVFDGVLDEASYTLTDCTGAMHVNPADFNTAGLLHQYGGAWRSNLNTNQFGVKVTPGLDIDIDVTALTLNRRGASPQQGDFELDVIVGRMFASGVHASVAYGFDNDERQVFFMQLTLFF
ncbi:MAG: hypothetical protein R3F30_04525 [Planctomycetota bacterium]